MNEVWEYKSVKLNTIGFKGGVLKIEEFDKILNELGGQGWELVVSFDTNQENGSSYEVVAVFKRKKQM